MAIGDGKDVSEAGLPKLETSSVAKAEHPILLSVRKLLETTDEEIFVDKNVSNLTDDPDIESAYITNVVVASDVAAEFRLYSGHYRDRLEEFVGDGSTVNFDLDYGVIESSDYISITVNSTPYILNDEGSTGYTVIDMPNGEPKSRIVFNEAPASSADIEVTYDAVRRVFAAFVQTSSSFSEQLGAPLKLQKSLSQFLIGSVIDKTVNESVSIMNINGYYEDF